MRFFLLPERRGFTLVELLVSMAVIAILSTVVYATMSSVRAKARDTERISELEQLRVAFRLLKDQTGAYPSVKEVLSTLLLIRIRQAR
jgi:prepilin-type N-terminal cleavage/methylation domain-containing protein